mgnify:FL=1
MAVGDRVGAGQVLATADTSDLETEIREVTASLERAQLTLSEAESDLESASDETQAAIDSINSQLDVLELQLAQAQDTRDEAASGSAEKVQAKITIIDTKASIDEVEDQKAELKAERSAGYPELTIAVGVAEQTVADLEQELETTQEQLELAETVAPVDGVISELNVTAGFTAPSSSAAVVVDGDTLEVVASDIGSLVVGQTASVSIDAVEQDVSGVVTPASTLPRVATWPSSSSSATVVPGS